MHFILEGSKKAHPIRIVGPPPRLPGLESDPRTLYDLAKPRKVSDHSFSNRVKKMVVFRIK